MEFKVCAQLLHAITMVMPTKPTMCGFVMYTNCKYLARETSCSGFVLCMPEFGCFVCIHFQYLLYVRHLKSTQKILQTRLKKNIWVPWKTLLVSSMIGGRGRTAAELKTKGKKLEPQACVVYSCQGKKTGAVFRLHYSFINMLWRWM